MRLQAVFVAGLAVLLLAGAAATYLIVRSIEARYPPAGRFVEVTGGRLHYVELGPGGKGPAATVLLLHGASELVGRPDHGARPAACRELQGHRRRPARQRL